MKTNYEKCDDCQEPTKRAVGCWDGRGTHGMIFDCSSNTCEIAAKRREYEFEERQHRQLVKTINADNGIDLKAFKALYLRKGQSIRSVAVWSGFIYKMDVFSDYMNGRSPFPQELYARITDWLESLPDEN